MSWPRILGGRKRSERIIRLYRWGEGEDIKTMLRAFAAMLDGRLAVEFGCILASKLPETPWDRVTAILCLQWLLDAKAQDPGFPSVHSIHYEWNPAEWGLKWYGAHGMHIEFCKGRDTLCLGIKGRPEDVRERTLGRAYLFIPEWQSEVFLDDGSSFADDIFPRRPSDAVQAALSFAARA